MAEDQPKGRARGGFARAKNLTPRRKSEIARKAAAVRWHNGVLKATHSGEIAIGSIKLPCYVLEDGTRVLTQTGAVQSLGMSQFVQLPKFMAHNSLKPFLSEGLRNFLDTKILFTKATGGKPSHGYQALILAEICDTLLQARKEGVLHRQHTHIADQCEMLMRALAKVGIIALIDEATGYQNIRKEDALQKILDAFLNKELAAWVKRFPDSFYDEMFRLKGWSWNSLKRPGIVGTYTNELVYERLAPALVEELKKKNPRNERGSAKSRDHQWLTSDVGHPALSQHLHAIIGLMRASNSWEHFNTMVDRAFPKKIMPE